MTTPPLPTPDGSLQDALDELLRSGSTSNPALNRLLDDYATYHATLVVVGGCFLVALLLFTGFCWRQFRRSRADNSGTRMFERKTYARLGLSSLLVSAFLAVVVAANLSSALDARQGLSGVASSLGSPPAGSSTAELQGEFTTWLQSSDGATPSLIEDRIDDRLAWQRPKAIITSVLLLLIAAYSVRGWRSLLRVSRVRGRPWTTRDRPRLVVAIGSVPVCLLLMLMVIGNTQASVAPLTMTMLFG